MGNILHKLSGLFERLPGIGPRQARRFVHALADERPEVLDEMAATLLAMKSRVKRCAVCFRIFESEGGMCAVCAAGPHDAILVAERDVDLENFEKQGVYDGAFHVLGGTVAPAGANADKLRLRELYNRVKDTPHLKEVILATSATNEGDATAAYTEKILAPFAQAGKIKITRLGRGLSSGSSLEFADRFTLEQAFKNRK